MLHHTQVWDGETFVGYRNMALRFHGLDRIESAIKDDEALPVVEHASLWDFYTAINYDHRRARLNGVALQTKRS